LSNHIKFKGYPKIGLLGCCSNASNTGALVAKALLEVAREFDEVGILSFPALAMKVPRQVALVKNKIKAIIVVDGCHQACASKLAKSLGLDIRGYINLESDLGIRKKGPFTTFEYSDEDCGKVKNAVMQEVNRVRTRFLG